jgi:D-sedoheptulose 7-phosphate isomerase
MTDTILTAIGNDYRFNEIFRRQVEGLCAPGDVVVGISTSGRSKNVCAALKEAKKIGAFYRVFHWYWRRRDHFNWRHCIARCLEGRGRIQEVHILAGHLLCDWSSVQSVLVTR